MTPHDARLAPAAVCAWAAAAAMWLGWGWWPLVAMGVVVAVSWARRSARPALVLAAIAGAGGALAGVNAVEAASPVTSAAGEHVNLVGIAATDAAPGTEGPTEGLWAVEVSVTSADGINTRARVSVWGDDAWRAVVRGQRVELAGTLAAGDGEGGLMWRPRLESVEPTRGLDAMIANLRAGLREASADLPPRLRPLTRGMVIGDDSGMVPQQREQMAMAGLTHLTAVSGSHFAIVLVAVTAMLRLVVRSRRIVAVTVGIAMALLTCLVFPEPSVVRAGTMAAVVCAALWWGRPAQALPALSAGVIVVSIMDPRLACEPGFAMSVAAVAAIALWAPALAARLEHSLPPVFAHPLAVCIAAQLAVLPLLALIGGGVSPWAVVANLAVGIVAAPVTLIGLCALVVAPFGPALAHALATVAGYCAWPVDAAARIVSSLPGAQLTVPPGVWGAAASALAVVAVVALTFARRVRLGMPVVAGLLVIAALAVPVAPRLLEPRPPADWLMVQCDVGQGDAMLVRSGPHSAIAVDVGPADGAGLNCLRRYGVTRIDLLVITHPHADHEGGLAEVLAEIPVAHAWISPAEHAERAAAELALAAKGVPVEVVHAGVAATVGDADITVLAPGSDAVGEGSTGLNDASVVTLVQVGGVSILGLGDLEHEGQVALSRQVSDMVVDVVKVPHHGSDRQEQALAGMITARVAIVSVGADNSYGHPAPDALTLWGSRAAHLVRTDLCGDIVVVPGPALATACPSDMAG
ncbi:ComEC/Rec2 family competence protein [Demequina sp.]|uniref:ComEC/Rec2 family competence protein n=1 Tax=Demequina sp. TaxID=2050685 RepID=UPI003D14749B